MQRQRRSAELVSIYVNVYVLDRKSPVWESICYDMLKKYGLVVDERR